jgi:hypothetical protein
VRKGWRVRRAPVPVLGPWLVDQEIVYWLYNGRVGEPTWLQGKVTKWWDPPQKREGRFWNTDVYFHYGKPKRGIRPCQLTLDNYGEQCLHAWELLEKIPLPAS